MKKIICLLLMSVCFLGFFEENPKKFDAIVTRVVDADTMEVNVDLWFGLLQRSKVRLFGVDTYESRTRDRQEKIMGEIAKAFVVDAVENKEVKLEVVGRGKFGRPLAYVLYKEEGVWKSVNNQLIDMGLAVEYYGGNKKEIWLKSKLPCKWNGWKEEALEDAA